MNHTVHEHTLRSGARGLVIDVPGSSVVNVRVAFHSGFQFSDPAAYEVPHIMEHLLATVTRRHAEPNAFNIEAQKNGAYLNASTSADNNEYIYEFANFELERILDLIEEQVSDPLFAQSAFEAERGNVREELTRNTTQHMSMVSIALAHQGFPKLWRGYEERIAQLDDITLDQLEAHYHRTHTAGNARFYAAGSFDDGGAALAARFDKIFQSLPQGARLPLIRTIGLGAEAPLVIKRDIDQLYYRSAMYFGELSERERSALSLLRMLMVGGMGSRVLGEARRRGLAYSVGATGHAEPGNSSFGFTGYVTPANAKALFEVMRESLAKVAAGEASATELTAAQDLLVGSITRSTQTAGDILGWYIDRYDDEGIIRDFEPNLEKLREVTLAEVKQLAATILEARPRGVCMLGRLDDKEAAEYAGVLGLA